MRYFLTEFWKRGGSVSDSELVDLLGWTHHDAHGPTARRMTQRGGRTGSRPCEQSKLASALALGDDCRASRVAWPAFDDLVPVAIESRASAQLPTTSRMLRRFSPTVSTS